MAEAGNFLPAKRVSFSEEVARLSEEVLRDLREMSREFHVTMESQFGEDWPSHLTEPIRKQLVQVAEDIGVTGRLVVVKKRKERLIRKMRSELA